MLDITTAKPTRNKAIDGHRAVVIVEDSGQPEITQLELPIPRNQAVARLDVPAKYGCKEGCHKRL